MMESRWDEDGMMGSRWNDGIWRSGDLDVIQTGSRWDNVIMDLDWIM